MFSVEAAKWVATARISWSKLAAYKLNFVLLVLGPGLIFFLVKVNLWRTIYESAPGSTIQGYDLSGMLHYQAWVMVAQFLSQSFQSMNLAEDVRMGRISSYLVYPFTFWKFHAASFLAFQTVQLGVAAFTLALLVGFDVVQVTSWSALAIGLAFSLLVGFFWFGLCFLIGVAAFWLEETWVLRVMFIILTQFLSGGILPIEIFPGGFRAVLAYTPFPYMTYVPARIFMGAYDGSVVHAAIVLTGWLIALSAYVAFLWRRGLRLYTGAGM